MTRDEFLVWATPRPERWQLVDGEPVAMAPASDEHAALVSELARLVGNHLLEKGSVCRGLVAPGVVPRVRQAMNHRIPDFGVFCPPRPGGGGLRRAVLLAEVLSPSNEAVTRANVWAYTTLPGLREVLLLRASRIEAELLRRDADGNWPAEPELIGADGQLDLTSIGFAAPLMQLYRTVDLAG